MATTENRFANDRTPRWVRIICYCAIAFSFSAIHRFVIPNRGEPETLLAIYRNLAGGIGPALGAIVVMTLFRHRSRISLFGSSKSYAILMISLPAMVMAVWGVPNRLGVEPHLFGFNLGLMVALYAILEEIGWRGYLQDELNGRPALLRYATVGVIWYAWHFSWIEDRAFGDQLITVAFMIAASIGIGFVADRTHAVLAAAAFHVSGDIMGLMPDFQIFLPDQHQRIVVISTCLLLALVVMRVWKMHERRVIIDET